MDEREVQSFLVNKYANSFPIPYIVPDKYKKNVLELFLTNQNIYELEEVIRYQTKNSKTKLLQDTEKEFSFVDTFLIIPSCYKDITYQPITPIMINTYIQTIHFRGCVLRYVWLWAYRKKLGMCLYLVKLKSDRSETKIDKCVSHIDNPELLDSNNYENWTDHLHEITYDLQNKCLEYFKKNQIGQLLNDRDSIMETVGTINYSNKCTFLQVDVTFSHLVFVDDQPTLVFKCTSYNGWLDSIRSGHIPFGQLLSHSIPGINYKVKVLHDDIPGMKKSNIPDYVYIYLDHETSILDYDELHNLIADIQDKLTDAFLFREQFSVCYSKYKKE